MISIRMSTYNADPSILARTWASFNFQGYLENLHGFSGVI